jgi:hypothetical protein
MGVSGDAPKQRSQTVCHLCLEGEFEHDVGRGN